MRWCGDRRGAAIRYGARRPIRIDLSATLFLSLREQYGGGGLVIKDLFGPREIRLEPDEMVLYPSSSLHHVTPVERGERVCAILWLRSLVRDEGERRLLFELDTRIRSPVRRGSGRSAGQRAQGDLLNLVRRWADA